MADKSKIEWTDASWNPLRASFFEQGEEYIGWHCTKPSAGCKNCYAERMNQRLGTGLEYTIGHTGIVRPFLDERTLVQPLRWKRPRRIFVCSMTDLFGEFHTDEMIDRVFAVMALCPQHTFQLLTKRANRMARYIDDNQSGCIGKIHDAAKEITGETVRQGDWPLSNVWAGVSVEDQKNADERVPWLLQTPAAVRWVSYEPALGPVNFFPDWTGQKPFGEINDPMTGNPLSDEYRCRLDWLVVGGESGPGARPMHPDWARSVRNQCVAAGVSFFFKQWGAWSHKRFEGITQRNIETDKVCIIGRDGQQQTSKGVNSEVMALVGKKAAGRLLDGRTWDEYPR